MTAFRSEPDLGTFKTSDLDARGPDLYCRRCGERRELAVFLHGCPACAGRGSAHNLEVGYAPQSTGSQLAERWAVWDRPCLVRHGELLPIEAETAVLLGEGDTPLVRLGRTEQELGLGSLHLKLEAANPTGSFKDRWNAVAISVARRFGLSRVAAASTGNQAISVAAYARAAGMEAVVMSPASVEPRTLQLLRYYGALTVLLDDYDEAAVELLGRFVGDGYYVSSRNWPRPFANPFGLEGYKTIAFELVQQMGGQAPDVVVVPVAGGDSVFGIWKGFTELHALGMTARVPRMFACQSTVGGASLVDAWEQDLSSIPATTSGGSLAVSISVEQTGDHALVAVQESDGAAFRVAEEDILRSLGALAAQGLCMDPSSAATLAACRQAHERGLLGGSTSVVCIGTATGMRWDATFAGTDTDVTATPADWSSVRSAVERLRSTRQVHDETPSEPARAASMSGRGRLAPAEGPRARSRDAGGRL